jgi:hypothetical protein
MESSDLRTRGRRLLTQIREGMVVDEMDGQTLGTVRQVFLGPPIEDGAAMATPSEGAVGEHTFLHDLAEAIAPDDLPQEIKDRLRLSGFIRIDMAGMLRADRYAFPEQITSVDAQRVTLGVSRDQLLGARSP